MTMPEIEIPPTRAARERAQVWLTRLHERVGIPAVLPPMISDTGDGGLMYEWWNHPLGRKITVFFSDDRSEGLRIWGADMVTHMADAPVDPLASFVPVWRWLWDAA